MAEERTNFQRDEHGLQVTDFRCPKCLTNKVGDFALEERTRYVRLFESVAVIDKGRRLFTAEDDGCDEEEVTRMRVACLSCGHRWAPRGWTLQVV